MNNPASPARAHIIGTNSHFHIPRCINLAQVSKDKAIDSFESLRLSQSTKEKARGSSPRYLKAPRGVAEFFRQCTFACLASP
jgi:hypothetical protein